MAGDYTRMTFTPRRTTRRADAAGPGHARRRLQRAGRAARPPPARRDRRHRRPLRHLARDARRVPDRAVAGGSDDDRPGPRVRRRAPRREPRRRARSSTTRSSASCAAPTPIAYDDQPYLPDAAAIAPLPTSRAPTSSTSTCGSGRSPTSRTPDLVEKAIAVDTAARLQTVWQVAAAAAPDGTTCDATVPAGTTLTAPSGRPADDRRGRRPGADRSRARSRRRGGYRGTENRLYRVEIHDAGPLGDRDVQVVARQRLDRFARRRDRRAANRAHASTGSAATASSASASDDWVEVIDDWLELNGLPGRPPQGRGGRRGAADHVTLAAPLTARTCSTQPTRSATRGSIRWDQAGPAVDAAGGADRRPGGGRRRRSCSRTASRSASTPTLPAATSTSGDYWVFAARTADASVEAAGRGAAARHPASLLPARRRHLPGHRRPTAASRRRTRGDATAATAPSASRPSRTRAAR